MIIHHVGTTADVEALTWTPVDRDAPVEAARVTAPPGVTRHALAQMPGTFVADPSGSGSLG
ncbi:hypothetical protein [Plantactinospora sp. GCM10030261]|uniref:hypothetical protein n=1 Tax=Plantactinospora sp. GCM10030261 TaxID=3273420 RepID=UPI00360EC251